MRLTILAAVLAVGCKGKSSESELEPEPESADESGNKPTADARAVATPASAPPPTGGFRAWLAAQTPGQKRVKAENIDKSTREELVEVGRALLEKHYRDRPMRLRWARALTPKSAAFSIGYSGLGGKDSVYSVALVEGDRVVARSAASVTMPDHADGGTGFGADLDVDGDGVDDVVVDYHVSQSGGGEDTYAGIILLGSRGSTVDIQTMARDAEYSEESYSHSTDPVVQCWTRIGETPVLISARETEADQTYEPGKKPTWDLTFYGADDRGALGPLEISGKVVKSGALDELTAKGGVLTGKDDHATPKCAGPIVVPDLNGGYRQVTDLAIGPPAGGRVALAPKKK